MMINKFHQAVLLNESIEGLNINPEGVYVDVTFGGGGHSKAILEKLTTGRLFAFDQDKDAKQNEIRDERFVLIESNYRYIKNFLKYYRVLSIDGLIADLGISSFQIDNANKGFSTRFDGMLDMRMNTGMKQNAKDIVNTYTEDELKRVFVQYGELENAWKISCNIIKRRNEKPIETTKDLKEAVINVLPRGKENKYLAMVFQALRIEVNDELGALKEMILSANEMIKPEGRLVIISYHSLEDRLVKNFIKAGNFEGEEEKDFYGNNIVTFKMVNKKPIEATEEEVNNNSRARSAKLRIAEKL